jgi:hypothetical protein
LEVNMRAPLLSAAALFAAVFCGGCDRSAPSVVAPSLGEETLRTSGERTVPFEAHYDFHVVSGPVEPCTGSTNARTYGAGEGVGTHLGRFTVTASQCALPGGITADGRGTYAAANGDRLYFTYSGHNSRQGLAVTFTLSGTFVGGTGRFEGATGSATSIGAIDLSTGKAWADWVGQISSVGSL